MPRKPLLYWSYSSPQLDYFIIPLLTPDTRNLTASIRIWFRVSVSLDSHPSPPLLPRQMLAQFGLVISDQLTAHVHCYFVDLTREWKRRLILRCHRRAHVRAAVDGAEQSDAERIGQRDGALSDLLVIDVEVALARRAFAVRDVGFACHLEFKPQLMTACGHGFGRFNVVQVPTHVVIYMAEFPVLNVQRVAPVVAAL